MRYPRLDLRFIVHFGVLSLLPQSLTASYQPIRRSSARKAGLGWPNGPNDDISQYYGPKVSWYYSWSPWDVPGADLEFVPMFWGLSQASDFQSQVTPQSFASRGWTSILAMNEPDEPGESNITAGQGAQQWQQYLQPLKAANSSIRLGSPACTNAPAGKQWMYDFFGACGALCTVDFVALHWYGLANATDFIAHVTDYYNSFNRPIWVTEWACQNFGDPSLGQCTESEIVQFLEDTQSWMDKTDFVERYAWFGAMPNIPRGVNPANALMSTQGTITALGEQYVGSGAGIYPGNSLGGPTSYATQVAPHTAAAATALISFLLVAFLSG